MFFKFKFCDLYLLQSTGKEAESNLAVKGLLLSHITRYDKDNFPYLYQTSDNLGVWKKNILKDIKPGIYTYKYTC